MKRNDVEDTLRQFQSLSKKVDSIHGQQAHSPSKNCTITFSVKDVQDRNSSYSLYLRVGTRKWYSWNRSKPHPLELRVEIDNEEDRDWVQRHLDHFRLWLANEEDKVFPEG